jgi:hypothetical protein
VVMPFIWSKISSVRSSMCHSKRVVGRAGVVTGSYLLTAG